MFRVLLTLLKKCFSQGVQHSDDGKLLFKIMGTPDPLPKTDEKAKNVLTDFIYVYATTGYTYCITLFHFLHIFLFVY